ncbi:MAG TPA: glycosyltransferase family 39 protein, partial [Prosthecobacter sp.]|nr:glycosyltransferase family 39 protein [Prosthecobacter sp.]
MTSVRLYSGVFLLLLAVAISAAWSGGAWTADVAGDPDEPAHAVTSLMMRDFVVDGTWTRPVEFAKAYYRDFPKVALGHYPPLYYVVAGVALLLAPKIGILMFLQATLLALIGTVIFVVGRRLAGAAPAVCAAVLSCLMPILWKLSVHVMADLLLVVLCLAAMLVWARYCERPSIRLALLFGFCAALAILTKGSGILLAAVPPITL